MLVRHRWDIEFYHRAGVKEDAVLAASWIRGSEPEQPTLTIHDAKGYEAIKKIHDTVCEKLKRPDILWETAVEKTSVIH